ncbi:protein FAM168A isoform A [Alligator mississippiensis]|uniref:Protein FAM168A isoform A n=1 Tax=Alligator mississippiensis TaxID=8496 RepID=A0A151PJC9_ALLMI|nr:protein FAM168A isoform A [Alligator mississippiensis]
MADNSLDYLQQKEIQIQESSQSSTMNPVYSPVQPGAPYGNPKNMAYTGYPTGYPTAAPAYNPNMYPTSSPGYAPATLLMKQAWPQTSTSCATEGTFHLPVDTGTENRTYQASSAAFRYTAGTPYKVPPTQSNSAPPPYSPSPNPYQTAMYPIRSAYPQQNLYAQGAYYTQPVYAAQPHVIHHTTVVQPNSIPSAIYPAPVAAPRTNGVAMGMVAGTTMAMSAGTLDPYLQLRTSTLVNSLANPYLESNIVCNYSSLTLVLARPYNGTKSVCKNKRTKVQGSLYAFFSVFL